MVGERPGLVGRARRALRPGLVGASDAGEARLVEGERSGFESMQDWRVLFRWNKIQLPPAVHPIVTYA